MPGVMNITELVSPPWLFSFFVWVGYLPFSVFSRVWLVVNIFLMGICSYLVTARLWPSQQLAESAGGEGYLLRAEVYLRIGFLLSFYPFYVALILGQFSPVVLSGLVLFLVVSRKGDNLEGSWQGGLSLVLTAFKPHLLYLVYSLILFRSLKVRRAITLLTLVSGGVAVIMIPLLFNPDAYFDYWGRAKLGSLEWWNPTIGPWLVGK